MGLFCRILSLVLGSFAKETYNLIDPTNQSHPILGTYRLHMYVHICVCICVYRSYVMIHICVYISYMYIIVYIHIYLCHYTYECVYTHIFLSLHIYHDTNMCVYIIIWGGYDGVATISRLLKINGLFCKRARYKRRYSAKESYNFKELLIVATPYIYIIVYVHICLYHYTYMCVCIMLHI